jgi:hypothetical protein
VLTAALGTLVVAAFAIAFYLAGPASKPKRRPPPKCAQNTPACPASCATGNTPASPPHLVAHCVRRVTCRPFTMSLASGKDR